LLLDAAHFAMRALHKCETITSASFHPLNGQTPFVSPGINSDAAATRTHEHTHAHRAYNAAFRSFRVARALDATGFVAAFLFSGTPENRFPGHARAKVDVARSAREQHEMNYGAAIVAIGIFICQ